MSPDLESGLWGLAVLASWVGWGRWVATPLGLRGKAHVGLLLVWGYAALLALGGWLCWLELAERRMLFALVALGLSGLVLRKPAAPAVSNVALPPGAQAIVLRAGLAIFVVGLIGLSYAIGLFDARYQGGDDRGAYLLHAKKILETGTLYEPFSFRRMASYGGQAFLQALVLVVAPIERLNLLDKGICRVAIGIALLAYSLTGPNRSLFAALVVGYAQGVYYDFATNTASLFSGVLAFVGLWMTLDVCRREPGRPLTNGLLTGLAAAATVPLRQNYALACGLIVLFEYADRLRSGRARLDWREPPIAAAAVALCAGGWALLQVHSCGTALFPLRPGFSNPEWNALSARDAHEFFNSAQNFLGYRFAGGQGLLCGLALFLPRRPPDEASLRFTAAAGLVAFAAHCGMLAHAHPHEFARYTAAFLVPTILLASAHAGAYLTRSGPGRQDWRRWLCVAYLFALLWFLPPTSRLVERAAWLREGLLGRLVDSVPDDPIHLEAYERLQAAAPPGAKMLVMLDRPYLLDLRRNDISSLDLPGGVSPPTGLARIETPQEVVRYFRELGYAWLAVVRPEKGEELHVLGRWLRHANGVRAPWQYDPSDVAPWQAFGRTIVHFYWQLETILRSCRLTHDDGAMVMIDLSHCRFERPLGEGASTP